ncbi:MarR family winged helix-turn-helix transcriptional regulator [Nodosilinea sp. PGN35]|uniref:MarR family winged helix-turn-helix transcriptional regulator n=1 Tax=Nodosilinea sp. PGN35 TaxID=3020489 RepID=UPI0023B28066|nr:MarR family winged helix-turn-helix transcriptional regulator [Nodosilinea sp. TSF1-S3]MDF0365163.1 MarR family winged helix-turn-helix transcriptional regulator [Nodosilinea sp. TSF1-S3]
MSHHEPEKLTQILVWIGVANQLMTTRFNQYMADYDLPLPQFSMLNHFSRQPQAGHTITQLTAAFQANQPAITKTVQHLLKKGYLEVQVSESDRRVKYHYITEAGLQAHREAIARILPDAQLIFSDWSPDAIDTLHQSLFNLKNWLDDHRDTVAQAAQAEPPQGDKPLL